MLFRSRIERLFHRRSYAAAAAGGLALGLVFPPSPLGPLAGPSAVLGIAAAAFAASAAGTPRRAFASGAAFGAVALTAASRGLVPAIGPLALVFIATGAFAFGGWACVLSLMAGPMRYVLAPAAWASVVMLWAWMFGAGIEAMPVMAFIDARWVPAIAGTAGRTAASAIVVALGTALGSLAAAVMSAPGLRARHAVAAAVVCAAAILGASLAPLSMPPGRDAVLAAVQTWYTNSHKWNPDNLTAVLMDLQDLTAKAAQANAALTVWPETAVPADPFAREDARRAIVRAARRVPVLAGALLGPPQLGPAARLFRGAVSTPRPVNVLLMVDSTGNLRGVYAKSRAFPYGEMGMVEGPGFVPIASPIGKLGALICWENVSSSPLAYSRQGVTVLAASGNLAWFGPEASAQYMAYSRLLAMEMRAPVIHAANRGRSAVIDPLGRIAAIGPENGSGVAVARVRIPARPSRAPAADLAVRTLSAALTAFALVREAARYPGPGNRSTHVGLPAAGCRRDPGLPAALAPLLVPAGLGLVYLLGYAAANLPLGRPTAPLSASLLAGGATAGWAFFGRLWDVLEERYGPGTAATATAAALMTTARLLMPLEAAIWMYFHVFPLAAARMRTGTWTGPAAALTLAAALAPVWIPLPPGGPP